MVMVTQLDDEPFFDLADPKFSVRSSTVKEARDESWYARTPYGLAVLRYSDMRKLLLDRRLRQGSHAWPELANVTGVFSDWWSRSIISIEGDDHKRLRRLINPAFAPRIVNDMKSEFETFAKNIANEFVHKGSCEFMEDFANIYASQVLCLILGLPLQEARHISKLSSSMGLALGVSFKEHQQEINEATEGMLAYADELVTNRGDLREDSFMAALVCASEDNDRLSDQELKDMILMLVFAGIDTTRNQLGLGITSFLQHPDQWDLLAKKPELAPAAVEEVMRLRPTITWVTREAVEDMEYGGITIKEGTTLHLLAEAAGTDPDKYEAGFDITAERERHFGFGGGVHHCVGHAIARSDMAVAFTILPPLMKNLRADGEATYLPDSGNTGPIALPIAFDPT